jgi:hypothetical protein
MPVISGGVVEQPGALLYQEVTFTEAVANNAAGTYTASITVPAGAYLVDVVVHGVALWDSAGNVSMNVGDAAVTNGMLIITSLKVGGDLLAGETLSCGGAAATDGGETGGDITGSMWTRRYLATERVISGVITCSGASGSAGRTRMVVIYTDPTSAPVAATFAAS